MKVIKCETAFLLYLKIFKQLASLQTQIILWQVSPESGRRQVSETHINSFSLESRKIYFPLNAHGFLKPALPIYGYIEDGALIFKTMIEEIKETTLCLKVPEEISLLEESEMVDIDSSMGKRVSDVWKVKRIDTNPDHETSDVMRVKSMAQRSQRDQDILNSEFNLSLEEEDKLFADKRESPRARPKIDKWVKVLRSQGEEPLVYRLFDLSRGGVGFICVDESEFTKGSQISIVGLNDVDLDDPLIGNVMSIRSLDGEQKEFKVGIKFTDGQS